MKFRLRPHSKDESKALNPEKVEKKPLYIHYDKEGNRIGDDGYPLTPKRHRLHNVFNAIFIWAIICAVIGAGCAIIAYAQGQQYGGFSGDFSTFDLVVYGGNMINGYSVATLLRVEAVLLIFMGIFGTTINLKGFHWLYDKASPTILVIIMCLIGVVTVVYQGMLLSTVGIPDPGSLIMLILVILAAVFMKQVAEERPTLRKAKIARTEVKKQLQKTSKNLRVKSSSTHGGTAAFCLDDNPL